jgi:hypothetical protein
MPRIPIDRHARGRPLAWSQGIHDLKLKKEDVDPRPGLRPAKDDERG